LDLINLPGDFTHRKCDDVLLRGKNTLVELYAVQQTSEMNAVAAV